MFSNGFSHYLSYGATDQQTVRELAGIFDGLLVPATVAAFQKEGTGGFVLSLSATEAATPYVIDPRFPLFQQSLAQPKRSHVALADDVFQWPDLIRQSQPSPADFTEDIIQTVGRNWAEWNGAYQTTTGKKFDKYAKRLGVPVLPSNAQAPSYVLAPYLMAQSVTDPWWDISCRLYEATRAAMADDTRCIHVVAATGVGYFRELIGASRGHRIALWVSALDELTRPAATLAAYGRAIMDSATSRQMFALYGGFFSVLLQNCGLGGSSHGIGYGEQRAWVELPASGPPPSRYYLPQLHRYMQPDEATRLLFADRRLAECGCADCGGEPPIALEYHALMKHSVRCRATEIEQWSGMGLGDMLDRLEDEAEEYRGILHGTRLSDVIIERTERQMLHLGQWGGALRIMQEG